MIARIVSAVVGLPILIGAVWFGDPWLTAVVLAVMVLASLEIARLGRGWGYNFHFLVPLLCASSFIFATWRGAEDGSRYLFIAPLKDIPYLVAMPLIVMRLTRTNGFRGMPQIFDRFYMGAVSGMYIGFLGYALVLRSMEDGRELLLMLLLTVFATDTTAYFVGRFFGRKPLMPRVSPSKTVEGAVAGMIGAVAMCVLAANQLGLSLTLTQMVMLGLLIGLLAQVGDLAESQMKRKAGVKDSGWLIPGHGGILDRLDSIVLLPPVVYYFLIWVVL